MQGVMFAGVLMPLPYIVYAVIQTVRGKVRMTGFGTLLAYIAVLIPLIIIAIQTVNDAEPAILTIAAVASGAAVAVLSLILLIRDLRRPDRALNQSYSLLGLGVGLLVIIGTLLTPTVLAEVTTLTGTSAASSSTAAAATAGNFAGGNFQAPELTADMASNALVQTIAMASGLSGEDVIAKINDGTSIQTMVTDGGGDVAAVKAAFTSAVEAAIDAGTLNSQMLTRFGDAATFADQLVQGELPAQLGQAMLAQLISGGTAQANGGSFAPPGNVDTTGAAETTTMDQTAADQTQASADLTTGSSERPAGFPEAPAGFTMPGSNGGGDDGGNSAAAVPAATDIASPTPTEVTPTATPAPTQTSVPTLTPFPTIAPTSTVQPAVTCSVLINFNLNLRSGPSPDDDLLLTIPFGTIVTASDHNADDWWQVTYEDVSGWVSGEYVTVMAGCGL